MKLVFEWAATAKHAQHTCDMSYFLWEVPPLEPWPLPWHTNTPHLQPWPLEVIVKGSGLCSDSEKMKYKVQFE